MPGQADVLEYLRIHGPVTAPDLCEALAANIYRQLYDLRRKGLVLREDETTPHVYRAAEEGELSPGATLRITGHRTVAVAEDSDGMTYLVLPLGAPQEGPEDSGA